MPKYSLKHARQTYFLCLLCVFLFSGPAMALFETPKEQRNFCQTYLPEFRASYRFGSIMVRDILGVLAEGSGQSTVNVFFVIQNRDLLEKDTLLKVETLLPSDIALVSHTQNEIQAHYIEGIDLPPLGTLALRNKNSYLQISNLLSPLAPHSSLALQLTFEKAGEISVSVPILDEEEFDYTMESIALGRCDVLSPLQ